MPSADPEDGESSTEISDSISFMIAGSARIVMLFVAASTVTMSCSLVPTRRSLPAAPGARGARCCWFCPAAGARCAPPPPPEPEVRAEKSSVTMPAIVCASW